MESPLSTLLSLKEAAAVLPGRRSARTVWKWATSGVNGVVLETVFVGRERFTSPERIERFISESTSKRNRRESTNRTGCVRGRLGERTKLSLVAKGLLR